MYHQCIFEKVADKIQAMSNRYIKTESEVFKVKT